MSVREQLLHALRTDATLGALRTSVIQILCDLDAGVAPTLRSATDAAPDTEPESAPATPIDSALGREYGL